MFIDLLGTTGMGHIQTKLVVIFFIGMDGLLLRLQEVSMVSYVYASKPPDASLFLIMWVGFQYSDQTEVMAPGAYIPEYLTA